jgi:HSP20 family protein
MKVQRYDPFDVFERMSEAFDLGIENWFDVPMTGFPENTWGIYEGDWSPRLDMYEDDDVYFIKVDVPGIDPENIDLNITNDVLTIKGERKHHTKEDESKKKGQRYKKEERMYGTFHRTIPLPMPVDSGNIDANLKDGVLYITLPKREETKPKKISVSVSSEKGGR